MAMMATGTLEEEYWAARRGAIVVDRSSEGRIRLTGRDGLDLLQRMSTNDLAGIQPGDARPTVLTTAVARIVDLAWVLDYPTELLMLVSTGQAANVRRWLARYIFFQDDVVLNDASETLGQLGLYGPRAREVAEAILPGAGELAENRFAASGDLTVLRARPLAGGGFAVIAPAARMADIKAQAEKSSAVPASGATFQTLRIEAGQPDTGHELTEGYIPLEANLWSAVSFTKGCYIGQEIIARMESRGRLAKTMVGLKLASEVPVGVEVRCGDVPVGIVSSTSVSPEAGPIALAFVKPAFAHPGNQVEAGAVKAEVVGFPIL